MPTALSYVVTGMRLTVRTRSSSRHSHASEPIVTNATSFRIDRTFVPILLNAVGAPRRAERGVVRRAAKD